MSLNKVILFILLLLWTNLSVAERPCLKGPGGSCGGNETSKLYIDKWHQNELAIAHYLKIFRVLQPPELQPHIDALLEQLADKEKLLPTMKSLEARDIDGKLKEADAIVTTNNITFNIAAYNALEKEQCRLQHLVMHENLEMLSLESTFQYQLSDKLMTSAMPQCREAFWLMGFERFIKEYVSKTFFDVPKVFSVQVLENLDPAQLPLLRQSIAKMFCSNNPPIFELFQIYQNQLSGESVKPQPNIFCLNKKDQATMTIYKNKGWGDYLVPRLFINGSEGLSENDREESYEFAEYNSKYIKHFNEIKEHKLPLVAVSFNESRSVEPYVVEITLNGQPLFYKSFDKSDSIKVNYWFVFLE